MKNIYIYIEYIYIYIYISFFVYLFISFGPAMQSYGSKTQIIASPTRQLMQLLELSEYSMVPLFLIVCRKSLMELTYTVCCFHTDLSLTDKWINT